MTREEFNNNSYLVNNNALYNKHTEHISTTEPLYLDGMNGSDNIVHKKSIDDGGDTPLKTHVAVPLEENSPLFAFGIVSEEQGIQVLRIFVYKTNGHVLGVNADGVIQEDTGIVLTNAVSNGYKDIANAHGYNIVGVSVYINEYNLGDTVEDWDAYEKIELPLNLSAIIMVYDDTGLAIDITNGAVGQIMCINDSPIQISSAKKYLHTGPPFADAENRAKTFIKQKYDVEITEWNANNVTVAIFADIPNSEKYIVLE